MNKDYLTSPLYDENFMRAIEVAKNNRERIQKILAPTFVNVNSIAMLRELLSPTLSTLNLHTEQSEKINDITSQLQNFYKNSYIHQAQEIAKSYSNLIKETSNPLQTLDLSNILTDFDSFIKEEAKRTYQEPKQSCSQINAKSEVNIITESDKVKNLNYAFINFEFHAEKFKEVFHKSYSYASERKMVAFGVANAFVYVVTLAAQIHPLLPFWLFSITSIVGLFMPSNK